MNDIIIIITRKNETCDGNQKEWEGIWKCNNSNWLAIYDNEYRKHEFSNNDNIENGNIENIKLVVFCGKKVSFYKKLDTFLSKIIGRNIMMAIHPGGGGDLGDVKNILCGSMTEDNNKIINDAVGYSLGCHELSEITNEPIVDFAKDPNVDNFKKLRQFILSKKLNPHLIALSILCQGYFAAHGKEGFKISDAELQKKAENNKGITESQNWWKPAFENKTDFVGTGICDELKAMSINTLDNSIQTLFNKTKSNGVDIDTVVVNAYTSLTNILKG